MLPTVSHAWRTHKPPGTLSRLDNDVTSSCFEVKLLCWPRRAGLSDPVAVAKAMRRHELLKLKNRRAQARYRERTKVSRSRRPSSQAVPLTNAHARVNPHEACCLTPITTYGSGEVILADCACSSTSTKIKGPSRAAGTCCANQLVHAGPQACDLMAAWYDCCRRRRRSGRSRWRC